MSTSVTELEREPSLDELQKMVGGYIEIVPMSDGRLMYVNEEGRRLGLPHNEQASKMLGIPILGNVVVVRDYE